MRDEARAITKAVTTPNSDTPYSHGGFDPRAEPIMLMAPVIEKSRYFSVQLIYAYTTTLPTSAAAPPATTEAASSSPAPAGRVRSRKASRR
jgi:hypothetical protein